VKHAGAPSADRRIVGILPHVGFVMPAPLTFFPLSGFDLNRQVPVSRFNKGYGGDDKNIIKFTFVVLQEDGVLFSDGKGNMGIQGMAYLFFSSGVFKDF